MVVSIWATTSPTSTRSPACTETADTTPPKGARTLTAPPETTLPANDTSASAAQGARQQMHASSRESSFFME